ncbi:MAG: GFA family protein [bacterium]|nr:GFA family protein [bacterium]
MGKQDNLEGGCLCGAVRYEVAEPFSNVEVCHCSQCARWTGHLLSSFTVQKNKLTLDGDENIGWYQSSELARRGFCKTCGSSLFWERNNATKTDILVGSLDRSSDQPTGLKTTRHIYVADKGDYYDIGDGVVQFPQYGKDPEEG